MTKRYNLTQLEDMLMSALEKDEALAVKDWTKVPPNQWPSKCPKCGAGLSYTSYEPYCANADCRWNNEPDGVSGS